MGGQTIRMFVPYVVPSIRYCQGMGALAGLLLTYVPEETAFWMMVRLMSDRKYACAGLYSPGFPELFK